MRILLALMLSLCIVPSYVAEYVQISEKNFEITSDIGETEYSTRDDILLMFGMAILSIFLIVMLCSTRRSVKGDRKEKFLKDLRGLHAPDWKKLK